MRDSIQIFRIKFPEWGNEIEKKNSRISIREWHYRNTGRNYHHKYPLPGPIIIDGDYSKNNHEKCAKGITDVHCTPEKASFMFKFKIAFRTIVICLAKPCDIESGIGEYPSGSASWAFASKHAAQ